MIRRIAIVSVVISAALLSGCSTDFDIRLIEWELGETVGADNFERKLFYEWAPPWGIQVGQFNSSPGLDVAIIARSSGVVLDMTTSKLSSTITGSGTFEYTDFSYPKIVRVRNDGTLDIIDRNNRHGTFANSSGKLYWQYETFGEYPGKPQSMDAGDLDGDGQLEFYALTRDPEIHRLDEDSTLQWKVSSPEPEKYELYSWIQAIDNYPGIGPCVISLASEFTRYHYA